MFESLVAEYLDFEVPELMGRDALPLDLPFPARANPVFTITGVRRCGKTYFMYQNMRALLDAGVARNLLFHFSFDDDRIMPYGDQTASEILEAYYKLVPQARQGCYLFFDEIQDVPHWANFIRRVAERENVTVVLTGSSSKLLSSDIPTVFRGRSLTKEMWPFSFREFCRFRGLAGPRYEGAFSAQEKAGLETAFEDYLAVGGFPAVQKLATLDRIQLLQGYASQIVAKDIVERFGTASPRVAERFSRSALRSTGLKLSVNAQLKALRAAGISVSAEKLYALLDDFEDAHLLFKVSDYTLSIKDNPKSSYKVYSVDPGLALAVAPASHLDLGQRLETATFIELKRRYGISRENLIASYSAVDCPKVDFVVGDIALERQYRLIQVAVRSGVQDLGAELSKKYRSEIGNLEKAMALCGLAEGTLITLDEEGEVKCLAGTIRLTPAWRWFWETGE